ncbi:hypothetical protein ACI2IY_09125 [Lysobacter enzymogenes]|uniref:hypothetical protein n=1 Tax=Lysobacter enzymogenes TaxID=69 RepID=UPI003850649A
MSDECDPVAPAADADDPTRWLHRLRNELNTVSMACAAAEAVLDAGSADKAQTNLRRAQAACARAAALLAQAPPRG